MITVLQPRTTALLAAAVYLLAHLAVGAWDVPRLWGIDMLRHLPLAATVGFGVVTVVLLAGAVLAQRRRPDAGGDGAGRPAASWRWMVVAGVLVTAVAVAAFGDSVVALLGDGDLLLRQLDRTTPMAGNEPGLIWLIHSVHERLASEARWIYRGISWLAGALFLLATVLAARAVGADRRGRWLVAGLLVTGGYVELFCGYVAAYPLLAPGILLYLVCGILCLRGRFPLWGCAAVLALLAAGHFVNAALAPSLAALAVLRPVGHEDGVPGSARRPHWMSLWRLVGAGLVLCGMLAAALAAIDFDLLAYASRLHGGHLLPLWRARGPTQAYALWDRPTGSTSSTSCFWWRPAPCSRPWSWDDACGRVPARRSSWRWRRPACSCSP